MTVWRIPDGITEITNEYVRDNMPEGTTEVVIRDSVKSIGSLAFEGFESLTSVEIPEGVKSIGHYAFSDCTGLESVVIPESVESIGREAFYGCESLKSVVISEGVELISAGAFWGCTSLQSVVIPDSVKEIDGNTFFGCRALNLIILPDVLVANRSEYAITANQTVIKYSDFNDWKYKNGLEGKSYSDQAILFLYQLQNDADFRPSWSEVLKQCPEVAVHDLLKFADKKPVCMPKFFLSNGGCDLEGKMADAEQSNPCFKVSIDGNDCPGFADALLQNLSLFDGTSFFCTAIDKHFRSHQSGDSLEDTLRP